MPDDTDTPGEVVSDAQRDTPAAVDEAAAVIDDGGLVVYPTETVYGLGADALDAAMARGE